MILLLQMLSYYPWIDKINHQLNPPRILLSIAQYYTNDSNEHISFHNRGDENLEYVLHRDPSPWPGDNLQVSDI